ARVENRDDVRVIEAACGFRFTEKAVFDILQLVGIELLRQGHGLDRHHAADLRVFTEIYDTHRALAQLFFHLIAAEHRFFHAAAGENHGAARMSAGAAENQRLGHRLGAAYAFTDILEFGIFLG